MELKTIIAIGLVVFIIGGLIFLKVRSTQPGRPCGAAPFTYPKERSFCR